MSDSQSAWMVVWERAARQAGPFEIGEVAPEVAERLGIEVPRAAKLVSTLLVELARMPRGRQFFRAEGNAIAPLPEFLASPKDAETARRAYPFEL